MYRRLHTVRAAPRPGARVAGRARIGSLVFCLLCAPLLRLGHGHSALRPALHAAPGVPPQRRGPFDAALHEAMRQWSQAESEAVREQYSVEGWDAAVAQSTPQEPWRLQLMARDPSGRLRQALLAARRAAALAATPEEGYQATLWLAIIEHDSGRHEAELRHARRLMALAPRRATSLSQLRRAAVCNGQAALACQADTVLSALSHAPSAR